MQVLLDKYKSKSPEIVFEWNDRESEAKGWVVINSLRNGAAGGGTRMRPGLTREEVISLAKVMEIKFTVSGPDIGGAKSGIDFDPRDPRRDEVLQRWYQAVYPLLQNYYGTGGDLNVDELKDVIPITEGLGLWHPQEGIVNGHLHSERGEKIRIIGQLRHGCAKIVEDPRYVPDGPRKYAVADMITGYGVAEAVRHYYQIFQQGSPVGKKAIIQGWGNVASTAASYLSLAGVKIVGILDREGGVMDSEGMDLQRIKLLFANKVGNTLQDDGMLPFAEVNKQIWDLGAEIFIPGAASKLVTRAQVDRMLSGGLEVVSCGANVPFVDDSVFFGPTAAYLDSQVALIPDFIANCGMARVFAYFMNREVEMTDEAIFSDVSSTIKDALIEITQKSDDPTGLSRRALDIALQKIM